MKTNSTTKTITVEASSNDLSSPLYIGFRMVYKKKKKENGRKGNIIFDLKRWGYYFYFLSISHEWNFGIYRTKTYKHNKTLF
jgi:hypothetical protein